VRIANHDNRLVLVKEGRYIDVETASSGRFAADVTAVFDRWDEFSAWARGVDFSGAPTIRPEALGAPVPRPPQIFAIGLNYRKHAEEAGWPIPEVPMVFTKFPSSVTGPGDTVALTGPSMDWEVELVVVMGKPAYRVSAADAWSHVAGLTIGQDVSDRDTQSRPATYPQFALGKSQPGFSPIGPYVVTADEFADTDRIELGCRLNGNTVQLDSTADFVFTVSELIEYISGLTRMLPGDLIFTGTPSGMGTTMNPPRPLRDGDEVTSWISGIGEMTQRFADPTHA
jgi:2,4-didehydro-3-deoxy-L-rhamnonate hydrolase